MLSSDVILFKYFLLGSFVLLQINQSIKAKKLQKKMKQTHREYLTHSTEY